MARNGHAPGFLREALYDWLCGDEYFETPEIEGKQQTIAWLLGQLWNCTDTLSGYEAEKIKIVTGMKMLTTTYAAGARQLMAHIKKPGTINYNLSA